MLNTDFFHTELPSRPMGKYAHIIMLRVTEGYALFQTDGELNRIRVTAGVQDRGMMTRIALFKRKQTTPERLNGRELLRNYGILNDVSELDEIPKDDSAITKFAEKFNASRTEPPYACYYNVYSCKCCPDCIAYGFAIGDSGSEKSKVYSDTAFSLTDYAISHDKFTLNAPYESGKMSDFKGEVTSRINSQDHVKPQVIFPAVITTRDLTASLFKYVLGNVLRTTRYGATTTRGGVVRNYVTAIVLSDGEIFSNLLFTQRLHDAIGHTGNDPVSVQAALDAAEQVIPALLAEDGARDQQVLMGAELDQFIATVRNMGETDIRNLLQQAAADSLAYHNRYVAKGKKSS